MAVMTPKPDKPGPAKGVPRPKRRTLDAHFPARLEAALAKNPRYLLAGNGRARSRFNVPLLAADLKCSRMVIGNYLKGKNTTIEALLLDDLARRLDVSAGWLLTGRGDIARPRPLSDEEQLVLNIFGNLRDESLRASWLKYGQQLASIQPPLFATAADPYRSMMTPAPTVQEPHTPGLDPSSTKPR